MAKDSTQSLGNLQFHPATSDRWMDLVHLFGDRGACAGCWCMHWRVPHAQWSRLCKKGGKGNKRGLKKMVDFGQVPGLLAYANGEPVGWCSIGPRETYPSLEQWPPLRKVDDKPV